MIPLSSMIKALSHEHNYHHEEEENIPESDSWHDSAQHTPAADRARFRRTEKIVDRILDEDDSDGDRKSVGLWGR